MVVYFQNCIGACAQATIELPDNSTIEAVIDAARRQWGNGTLIRSGKELIWNKVSDRDADWRGCCANKISNAVKPG